MVQTRTGSDNQGHRPGGAPMKLQTRPKTADRLTLCECCGSITARRSNATEQLCSDCRREIEHEDAHRAQDQD